MINKIVFVCAILLVFFSCKENQKKDYVTFSGTITNKNSDSLYVLNSKGFQKIISVDDQGIFSDTLKVTDGSFLLYDGKEQTYVYLKNGYDLKLTLDAEAFDETLSYTGIGAEANNYLVQSVLLQEKVLSDNSIFLLDKNAFENKVNEISKKFQDLLNSKSSLDTTFTALQTEQIENLQKHLNNQFEENQYIATVLAKGNPSPKFIEYENFLGGTTSLDDLSGKHVYIDMWATWCGPCIKEIPYLKKLEEHYKSKNIHFVSISIDKSKDYKTWKDMVKEKELAGIQLYAKEDETFANAYKVNGIPRFILIGPDGTIVDANAPRPSDKSLITLFDSLDI